MFGKPVGSSDNCATICPAGTESVSTQTSGCRACPSALANCSRNPGCLALTEDPEQINCVADPMSAVAADLAATLVAAARRKRFLLAGDEATLDASKSWSSTGSIQSYEWLFSDGTQATGPMIRRNYSKPGFYSEILKVTDKAGNIDYDFAEVHVVNPKTPDRYAPGIHAVYWPTFGNRPGQPITFKVRSFRDVSAGEVWDFGDGSPPVRVESDGNANPQAEDGYAETRHIYRQPGDYLVQVVRRTNTGQTATARLHIRVAAE